MVLILGIQCLFMEMRGHAKKSVKNNKNSKRLQEIGKIRIYYFTRKLNEKWPFLKVGVRG